MREEFLGIYDDDVVSSWMAHWPVLARQKDRYYLAIGWWILLRPVQYCFLLLLYRSKWSYIALVAVVLPLSFFGWRCNPSFASDAVVFLASSSRCMYRRLICCSRHCPMIRSFFLSSHGTVDSSPLLPSALLLQVYQHSSSARDRRTYYY